MAVLDVATGCERGEPRDEEVESGERHKVHKQLTQVRIQLTGESKYINLS